MEEYMRLIGESSKDAWKIFKTHTDSFDQNDNWWQELIKEVEKVYQKYKGTEAEFYTWHYLTFVIMPEIERMSRADKKGKRYFAVTEETYQRIIGEKKT